MRHWSAFGPMTAIVPRSRRNGSRLRAFLSSTMDSRATWSARARWDGWSSTLIGIWAQIPISVLDQPSHRALALQVARESMVLLKNARNLLPLRRDLGTIAVIGPNADQWRMLLGNYNGIPADPVTPLRGIREAVGAGTRVLYARGADLADGFPVLEVVPPTALLTEEGRPGLDVAYFMSRTMEGTAFATGKDTTLDVTWRDGAPREG